LTSAPSRRFAVIGDPVAHSKSPAMHAAAYRALGLPHAYEAVRVAAGDLPRVVAALREGTYDGINVTVPHKEAVLALVDAVDESVESVGAANTLVRVDGRVVAYNTDARALAQELRDLAGPRSWPEGAALILGSGGAARAALAALRGDLGVTEIVLRARSSRGLPTAPLRASSATDARVITVVQATSAGMHGAAPGEPVADAVAWEALPAEAIALDVVYAPPDTPFLRAARARGLRCANGLGMLARQGALAFELWLGQPAPLDAMRAAL
jgi:shikimate dehydrogenase